METSKLDKWSELLLDTGKRNNLINFKDTKTSTAEVVVPESFSLLERIFHTSSFEVFDPKISDDDVTYVEEKEKNIDKTDLVARADDKELTKKEYVSLFEGRLKKSGQILVYNSFVNPIRALRNIRKKAKTAIEETGVNIAYLAIGFIHWTESENSNFEMKAPILLVPISIENESAVEPYCVKVAAEDIIVNPTFSFKLQNDYNIKLPDYNEDEGAQLFFDEVAQLVSKLQWSISTECKIGVFSFFKINMYKDLKDNELKILDNKNIGALLGKNDANTFSDATNENRAKLADLLDLHTVVDADSSQSEAIEMAREGKSFVLQGPPGTGKSQTITNIIAESLSENKKVLFVSEKLAALSVVYDKLKKAGLEQFCLELHSHKTNKKQVIDDLCQTLKAQKTVVSDNAQKELEIYKTTRSILDSYAAELHDIRPIINISLYSVYERLAACRTAPDMEFVIPDLRNKGEEYIEKVDTLLSRYTGYVQTIGYDYHNNIWYGYDNPDNSYQFRMNVRNDLQKTRQLCLSLQKISKEIKEKYEIKLDSINQALAFQKFFNLVKNSQFITPKLLIPEVLIKTNSLVNPQMKQLSLNIKNNKQALAEAYDEDIYELDGYTLYKKLSKQFKGFFARLFSREYKSILSNIRLCRNDEKKQKYKSALLAMKTLSVYQQDTNNFANAENSVKEVLSDKYCGVDTDFDLLIEELECLGELKNTIEYGQLTNLSYESFLEEKVSFTNLSAQLDESLLEVIQAEKRLEKCFLSQEFDVAMVPLSRLAQKCDKCVANIDKLDDWNRFRELLKELDELKIHEFIDKAIIQKIDLPKFTLSFDKSFYSQWVDCIIHESKVLSELSRIPHDEKIELFKQKDESNFEINKAKIREKLSAQRPSLDMVAQGSAIAILLREGEKKRKQKAVRPLLAEIGDLVQTLKPCFLMSPLSVSTFLSPDMKFDLVVFDEASQIFPQDAIGAIYRGKQLIVVGDSKQMPPSNFFNAAFETSDDEDMEDITDFESILDLCSISFPQQRLKWHYRSRSEQLIAFSNKNFYDNELITFPSSKSDVTGIGVDYHYVKGTFDRHSKTNRLEAKRVVELVFENIDKYPNRSLGVVAFSVSQQDLIEELLTKRRQLDSSKEPFFKSSTPEPFFVKNLETVQGDERDTIIFSVAYAQDIEGRLLLNFGPINREGGERRLNVAVTRAKINVQIVSSMHYSDIDLSRTKSNGARLLREYLDYAENGEIALERSLNVNSFEQFDSEFEMEVCEFLKDNGFTVDTQVGCSSFKIDLALRMPNSSDYVLAIECDGASYHSSKNARDRDRLRQDILEGMGWNFYRIWSTDWFRNKRNEQTRLLNAVKSAIEKSAVTGKKDNNIAKVSFEDKAIEKHFKFPKYEMVSVLSVRWQCSNNLLKIILAVLLVESPLSEEWLLKRIACLYGRRKVTSYVTTNYEALMKHCDVYGIVRKNKFLYLKNVEIPMLRVPSEDGVVRDIKYISLEELANGIKELLKQNMTADKSGLFKLLVQQLGFSKVGEAVTNRLELALKLIGNDLQINGEILALK